MSATDLRPQRRTTDFGTGAQTVPFLPLVDHVPETLQSTIESWHVDLSPFMSVTRGSSASPTRETVLVPQPEPAVPEASRIVLQAWHGRVDRIGDDGFTAILIDQTDQARPDEQVTISINDIDPADRPLVTEGSIFYWFVFQETRRGTRRNVSDLRFRRLPVWSKSEIEETKRRAIERAKKFNIDLGSAGAKRI